MVAENWSCFDGECFVNKKLLEVLWAARVSPPGVVPPNRVFGVFVIGDFTSLPWEAWETWEIWEWLWCGRKLLLPPKRFEGEKPWAGRVKCAKDLSQSCVQLRAEAGAPWNTSCWGFRPLWCACTEVSKLFSLLLLRSWDCDGSLDPDRIFLYFHRFST